MIFISAQPLSFSRSGSAVKLHVLFARRRVFRNFVLDARAANSTRCNNYSLPHHLCVRAQLSISETVKRKHKKATSKSRAQLLLP